MFVKEVEECKERLSSKDLNSAKFASITVERLKALSVHIIILIRCDFTQIKYNQNYLNYFTFENVMFIF